MPFDKLKAVLTETPVLAYPDMRLPLSLDTDASNTGIGAVLSKAGTDRPCWEEMAPLGSCTKAQWSSLQLVNGVVYRLWETPEGDKVVKQLVVPRGPPDRYGMA